MIQYIFILLSIFCDDLKYMINKLLIFLKIKKNRMPIDRRGNSSLMDICISGKLNIVKELIQQYDLQHEDIMHKNLNGTTVLHKVCGYGYLEILKFLIDKYDLDIDDINTQNIDGETPLFRACINGYIEVVKYIVTNYNLQYCNIMQEDNCNNNALYAACKHGHLEIVQYLLLFCFPEDILHTNINGESALSITANDEILKMLLERSVKKYILEYNYKKLLEIYKIKYIAMTMFDKDKCCICLEQDCNMMTTCGHSYCIDCYLQLYYICDTTNTYSTSYKFYNCAFCRSLITKEIVIDKSLMQ